MSKLKRIPKAITKLIKNRNPKVFGVFLSALVLLISAAIYFTLVRGDERVAHNDPTPLFVIPPEAYKNLEKQEDGKCAGAFQVTNLETGEFAYCSHGPEVPEVSFRNAVRIGSEIKVPGDGVQCTGDNTTGQRIQAIYAYAEDQPDRYSELQEHFQRIADNASNAIAASAQKTGGKATLKWVTDADCNIAIAKVKLRATQDDSFSETINAVQKADFDDPNKKYLIWTDADLLCGIATFITHDEPDPDKNHNSSGISSSYSRVDRSCWGESELHEILHTMGAVQASAPHSVKGGGHCTDGYEIMCRSASKEGCGIGHMPLLDCNNDDYFSANPAPGSYLATHWNVFNSNYLVTNKTRPSNPNDTTSPPKPYDVSVFDIRQDGFRIKWKLPSTEDIKKIHVEVNGAVKVVLLGPSTETYSFASLKPSTRYTARVVTIDANDNKSYSQEVGFTTLATPATAQNTPASEPGSIVPHGLKVKSINGSVVTLTAVIDRVPDTRTEYVIWRSTGVGYRGYRLAPTNTPKTYEFVDEQVYPQTVVTYHLRVQREDGSEIARTNEIPLNFTGSHEDNPPPAPTGFALKQYSNGSGYYIEYNQMTDDSGIVHHYNYAVTGSDGYSYTRSNTTRILSPPNLQSGKTYTVTAEVFDIWGNVSSPSVNSFTLP